MAPLQDMWYLEITLHVIHGSLGRDLSKFLSTSSLLRSNTAFDTGLSTMLFLPAWSTLPIFNLTLHTNPFWSQYVCMPQHICQSFLVVFASCKITISPTFKFLLVFVHFFLTWSDCKNSFLQWHQNSFTTCWTPSIFCDCINRVSKNLPEVARLSLISWLKDLMETGANYWSDH